MNVFAYYQNYDVYIESIPSKNRAFLRRWIHQCKMKNLAKRDIESILSKTLPMLKMEEMDKDAVNQAFEKEMALLKKPVWYTFLDFPIFTLLMVVLLDHGYELLFGNGSMSIAFGASTCIRIVGLYFIFKLLLLFLSKNTRVGSLLFFVGIVVIFGIYIGLNYVAMQASSIVFFHIPFVFEVVIWVALTLFSFRVIQKEYL